MASERSFKLRWLLVIPLLIVAFYLVMGFKYSGPVTKDELNQKFVVINPLDLSQIKGFSKYRSCMGHDYRGPLVDSEKESTPRSMKHYVKVKEELGGKNGVVKAIAPFNGRISNFEKKDPERKPYDQQVWLTPDTGDPVSPRLWHFVFFHIDVRDDLKEGSPVKAGEVIGTAYMTRGPQNFTDNFDMAVKFTRPGASPAIDFPMDHFSDEVLSEYAKVGITPENMTISKEYRDQNSCPTTGESLGGDVYFTPNTDPNDMIFLQTP
ncbi:hypothetical protein A3G67_01080 [Candidatus Roizmanbacteria bacterium RIFCSPLOWO2_12_FULL_40_12]|uniref:Uncharacterized protein n=1 Tax=Candidatus Roizmanbacteria bacterium RIFCSPLOWO2_01_FULL_40_42 TaxID=1802066 RepID=A0A1F7J218_9BACT|nr:MAG: hypothetical protein A2779_03605 [Candidatus Roizmanbacteria bacterium RIFCSPHIGHO2_01_FULL_40_98]OGK27667.1 MAG: hypothetical protein A3C31_04075 [Candidatus Roizmanbacteria bacterium RIFCSPHIGHO2_02_FULL_40_53]OGK29753.1 MAG: hypothetical protein A2W49_04825 [Candidatus Roizmanbacteria bacterium RIFCSPHIGHO2_12_41_18]OGK37344.1 MAG: hypothetical protein A3E69_04655 [Candidatus Roizmanbacteria bacterium RIFCSPHIGHO2_12_FULL_40_130]OGK49642.1 MAG: hypothetical protein A3B50_04290 [Candi